MRKILQHYVEGSKRGPKFSTPLGSIQSPQGRQLQVLQEGSKSSPDLHRSPHRCKIERKMIYADYSKGNTEIITNSSRKRTTSRRQSLWMFASDCANNKRPFLLCYKTVLPKCNDINVFTYLHIKRLHNQSERASYERDVFNKISCCLCLVPATQSWNSFHRAHVDLILFPCFCFRRHLSFFVLIFLKETE